MGNKYIKNHYHFYIIFRMSGNNLLSLVRSENYFICDIKIIRNGIFFNHVYIYSFVTAPFKNIKMCTHLPILSKEEQHRPKMSPSFQGSPIRRSSLKSSFDFMTFPTTNI